MSEGMRDRTSSRSDLRCWSSRSAYAISLTVLGQTRQSQVRKGMTTGTGGGDSGREAVALIHLGTYYDGHVRSSQEYKR